jgi:hypothetical protein
MALTVLPHPSRAPGGAIGAVLVLRELGSGPGKVGYNKYELVNVMASQGRWMELTWLATYDI